MKTTKNEDDQKLRRPKTKTTKNKDDQKRRRPKMKTTINEDCTAKCSHLSTMNNIHPCEFSLEAAQGSQPALY